MDRLETLYIKVLDDFNPYWERKGAMSEIATMYLTDSVIETLSKIARDTALPLQIRQMASDRLFKPKLHY
jgi:hypothetical protein